MTEESTSRRRPAHEPKVYAGTEALEVKGEAKHQAALGSIAGGRSAGRGEPAIEVVATLQPEPLNPVDPHAVAVFVGDRQVGYLDREDAASYEAGIRRLASSTGRPVALRGVLIGGFMMEDGTQASYGIRLRHNPNDFAAG